MHRGQAVGDGWSWRGGVCVCMQYVQGSTDGCRQKDLHAINSDECVNIFFTSFYG